MKKHWNRCVAAALCLFLFAACDGKKQAPPAPAAQATQEATSQSAAAAVAFPLTGKAKEVLAGGGFTYLLLPASGKEIWVAVPETEAVVGEEVTVASGEIMENFHSKTLDRTFAQLVFAKGLEGKAPKTGNPHGAAPAAAPPAAGKAEGASSFQAALNQEAGATTPAIQPGQPEVTPGSGKAVVPFADLKVDKAAGPHSYTVAELFAKAKELNGKKVKLRGQVVKFSPSIMGKNWLHLQDGSGDPMKNTHDLVVTSAGEAAKGDVVTVEGTVAADKDFGYGYKYDVIIEDVTITK